MKEAAKAKDPTVLEATLASVGRIGDKAVVKEIAKSLKSKQEAVALAAITALRWNEHADAIDALLKAAKDKKLMAIEKLAIELTYALGQKADTKALKALTDGYTVTAKGLGDLMKAKTLALGRIRDKAAVEAILDFINSGARRRGERRMPQDALIALHVLTGQEPGKQVSDWMDWWYEEKGSLKIHAEEWPLPDGRAQRQWDRLWEDPETRSPDSARGRDGETRRGTSGDSDEDRGPPQREDGSSEGRASSSAR
ncbi:MAG: HEAT repeat domain-containing protein [Planctomycetota bacterium]